VLTDSTLRSPDQLALTPRLVALGPQMEDFRNRVLRLQQVVRICEEVRSVANMNVLDGALVAESMRGALAVFDSDSLIGDEIANEAENYE
jgi:hypothetical protein